MTCIRKLAVLLCPILLPVVEILPELARAETTHDSGQWLAFFGNGNLSPEGKAHQFKWWFDGHARFFDDTEGFGQSIVRPGIGYALEDWSAVIWAGYGWIRTSPATVPDFDEHRIWQQLTWSKDLNELRFGWRSRLEQRFVETGSDTGWRFRQLVSVRRRFERLPRLNLVAWNELFIHLNDTNWGANAGFDQNRIFAGCGLRLHPESSYRLEIGYMNQFINRVGGPDLSNHILSINLYWNP